MSSIIYVNIHLYLDNVVQSGLKTQNSHIELSPEYICEQGKVIWHTLVGTGVAPIYYLGRGA